MPLQTENWADLKAAYRLLDEEDVTFARLAEPHWRRTRERSPGTWLVLGDTTEVDFGRFRQAAGLGPLGKGTGRGFLLHSGLMVRPETEEVVGLAGQAIRYRRPKPKGERYSREALKRDRESVVWGQVIEQVGPPAEGVQFIHVFDRGADSFEVFCRLLAVRSDWVVRAGQLRRKTADGSSLAEQLAEFPLSGCYELSLRAAGKQPARTAQLEVRHGAVAICAPSGRSPWLKQCGVETIAMHVIEVREAGAPAGVEPLHWVLLTSLPVKNFNDAWRVIGYYEKRPIIEEFHKALKTGCRLQSRQHQTSDRLEAVAAMLSVVAVRLLQLRSVARSDPQRPVDQVVPQRWTSVLKTLRRGRSIATTGQFYRELAGLGGFLGRKHDGEPGWLTIWRGFEKLQLAVRAVREYQKKCG